MDSEIIIQHVKMDYELHHRWRETSYTGKEAIK